ncbi:flavin-containing amine oxidase [Xylariales sp. PMI_506]|nr:flavin-containing amine oxidase [Xylariales sp. PMI_506]
MLLTLVSFFMLVSGLDASPESHARFRDATSSKITAGNTRDLVFKRILDQSPGYGNFAASQAAANNGSLKVGIVGAGAAGLYSAILLQSLGIDYEILEVDTRIGGRIYTHRFDESQWSKSSPGEPDYYNYVDIGAMRFPGMDWMDRVIGTQNTSIVSYINANVEASADKVTLVPYYFTSNNTFRLFNDKLEDIHTTPSAATFGVSIPGGGGTVDNATFSTMSPDTIFNTSVADLMAALESDFDSGFNKLMEYDQISVRQYLLEKGFTSLEVDWLETINDATEHYDTMSLSQAVMEQWIFESAPPESWRCVEGGMERLINGMVKVIQNPVVTSKRVTGLKPGPDNTVTVVINGTEERTYAHVINTPPLGVIQTWDMTELNLDYGKKLAIRTLRYDPAGKIGLTFKTRWWEQGDTPIIGGQSYTDLPIRRTVYPSYGVDTEGAAGAMLASYTWGQDSARLGAWYDDSDSEEYILNITLRDLARLNNVTADFLHEQLDSYIFWNWYAHPHSIGAFASFLPGQFSTVLPPLLQPAYDGKVHFAGEALSSGHGWIIGAVNSAYRAVAEVLAVEGLSDKLDELVLTWGQIDEVDMGWYTTN